MIYCSFDIETSGDYCGNIQLLAELFCIITDNKRAADPIINHIVETFSKYAKPPKHNI